MSLTPQETKIATRQELLEQIFSGLQASLGPDFEHLTMNRMVLHNVVVSYFHDVDRHKDFHGTERVDQIKQTTFVINGLRNFAQSNSIGKMDMSHPQFYMSMKSMLLDPVWHS